MKIIMIGINSWLDSVEELENGQQKLNYLIKWNKKRKDWKKFKIKKLSAHTGTNSPSSITVWEGKDELPHREHCFALSLSNTVSFKFHLNSPVPPKSYKNFPLVKCPMVPLVCSILYCNKSTSLILSDHRFYLLI